VQTQRYEEIDSLGVNNTKGLSELRVVLSTRGKFHTFDLARQMHRRGALVSIFTGYPKFKLKNESLPQNSIKTFPWLQAPYMRIRRKSEWLKRIWEWQIAIQFDRYVAKRLPLCDVFCGLSGSALETAKVAKSRGAKFVCDRGSSHIRFQDQILREEYELQGIKFAGIDPRFIAREEAEYDLADLITVPSTFVFNSFVKCGIRPEKLRRVPYGVDLSTFKPVRKPDEKSFHVLYVGGLTVRKGISYLVQAFEKLQHGGKHLTLVGSVDGSMANYVDNLRNRSDVSVTGHIEQQHLKDVMSGSHVMVLPSLEEGLALVQAQAMACACPVIATANTGGADIFTDGVEGFVVPIRNPEAIAARLQTLADTPSLQSQMSAAALQRTQALGGWAAYGDKMHKIFGELARVDSRITFEACSHVD
jgi:glycosyltransferase involved in cell wall biosynthesis